MATFHRNMSVCFRKSSLYSCCGFVFVRWLGHRHNEGGKRITEMWKWRRKAEGNTQNSAEKKKKKLKMKDLSGNVVQNISSLVYNTRMLSETRNVVFL